jgi:hypothetical protein
MYRLLPLLFLLAAAPAHAQVFKWVDASGNTHYSDQPPPASTTGAKKLNVQSQPASPAEQQGSKASTGKSISEKEMEFRKRRVEGEEATAKQDKAEADAKLRQQNCGQARGTLRSLQEGRRITRYNNAGERVYLGDDMRAQETARAQKDVETWCK